MQVVYICGVDISHSVNDILPSNIVQVTGQTTFVQSLLGAQQAVEWSPDFKEFSLSWPGVQTLAS